ncbi:MULTISPECIES: protein phosphatase [unclassified Cyanobium]|uniref:protein phosphatase n=1 Tax=unclassified Cyanobium TaxID=2627006 RepID=UPI0020CD9EE5|nr:MULTISPECIES: protein phosphatase [unclassified Cyanobium]MCP9835719.1 protein phosphatase [Cyanobium sp. La Preciosa 7G6]MCP9938456.1 protein phosphatase [Cyanobium sp. Aljojuca 7A6]
MDPEPLPSVASLQGTLFDFAIAELVRGHRDSFPPLWTAESWAKLLIWLALSCGCSGEARALEAFAAALGPALTARMRRLFFERELPELNLRVMADPAEPQVLVLPLAAGLEADAVPLGLLDPERVAAALQAVGLSTLVTADRRRWQPLEALMAVPWQSF